MVFAAVQTGAEPPRRRCASTARLKDVRCVVYADPRPLVVYPLLSVTSDAKG